MDEQVAEDQVEEVASLEREVRKRLALEQIRQYGDPILRMRANEVEEFGDEIRRVAEHMTRLMHEADGLGLAATQVGILRRFFVFHHDDMDHVLVNPVLSSVASETETDTEGCLSLTSVHVPVERATAVIVEARDASGEPLTMSLTGLDARVVQHELDHLDGTLIIDRTDPESRREALRQLRPRLVLG